MLQFLDRLHGKGAYRATTAHSLAAKSFHWGFIVLFVFALSKQIDELEELEDAALCLTIGAIILDKTATVKEAEGEGCDAEPVE